MMGICQKDTGLNMKEIPMAKYGAIRAKNKQIVHSVVVRTLS